MNAPFNTPAAFLPPGVKDRSFRILGDTGKGVMLIHGLTGAPQEMKPVGRVLHKKGFSLYGPMLAGHGGTEADLLKTDWRDWVDSAAAAYEAFAREVDEVYVAGICAGGAIGLELCARYPQIKGAAVYSMLFEYDGWNMPKITLGAPLIQAVANLPGLRSLSFAMPHPFGFKDPKMQALAGSIDSLIPGALDRMPLGCMYQLYRLARRVETVAPTIKAPVLVAHAREDDMANLKNAHRLAAALGGRTEVVVMEDSYHMIHVDREHAKLAAITADFFGAAQAVPAADMAVPA
ncbi:alpha/beta hydrolase [Phenylobacterium sp.]|uniref:alpha/beta hydrolase n=1 Tax=Phenylobacterium sp. TaxID=1871053 RepID=UPI002F4037BC